MHISNESFVFFKEGTERRFAKTAKCMFFWSSGGTKSVAHWRQSDKSVRQAETPVPQNGRRKKKISVRLSLSDYWIEY
jgi:hypothetical protein